MIEALIFDLDDTLVNNTPLIQKAQATILKRHGIAHPEIPKSIMKTFFGMRAEEIARIIIDYFSLEINPKMLIEEQDEIFLKLLEGIKPMPGFTELITFLRYIPYELALATSARKIPAQIKVQAMEMEDLFSVVITGDDIRKGKPDPEIFLFCAKKLDMFPENCIVIEDADNGIIAAKRAGMKTIGVRNSVFDSQQDLSEAEVVVDNLAGIKKAVHSLE